MRQRGFTLVELLVALAVGTVLLLGASLSVNQILVNSGRSNSQVVVLDEVHRAALQIKKDIQSCSNTTLTTGTLTDLQSGPVTFGWTDQTDFAPEDARDHESTYTLSGTELIRTFDNMTGILGRQIEYLSFTKNVTENATYIDVVITANSSTSPPRSETLSFSVRKRIEEAQ